MILRFAISCWNYFFPVPQPSTSLGQELTRAREAQDRSVSDVAATLHLSEEIILELERDHFSNNHLFQVGYSRLIAVRYARFLGMELSTIHALLPPVAPLQYPGCTLVKNLSHLQQKPQKAHFEKIYELKGSVRGVVIGFLKFAVILFGILLLVYLWNMVRYLGRVLF